MGLTTSRLSYSDDEGVTVGAEARTQVDVQLDAAMSAKRHSGGMGDELDRISRDVEDLLRVWRGGSAKAYGDSWGELKEAVQVIIDDLDDIGDKVAAAAQRYDETDGDNSTSLLRI
ncbi:WXG100 family type VII secretion target [Gordonia sp. ABSL11-1]|uniref:WXG100 family type VII secretion target n=1 Tax=Gordonia sp. ABSL11-1 TaxID=3053924 RepID=UPI0025729039|nr:WXG100 family type VII secretion target [Gordonia sp. ABSL11-1]MDL9944565.1 WXG100 family type VII secretion target [Gordonia sp. ABSL11-1]